MIDNFSNDFYPHPGIEEFLHVGRTLLESNGKPQTFHKKAADQKYNSLSLSPSVYVCQSHQPVDDTLDGAVPLSDQRVCLRLQQELVACHCPQLKRSHINVYVWSTAGCMLTLSLSHLYTITLLSNHHCTKLYTQLPTDFISFLRVFFFFLHTPLTISCENISFNKS